jgi:hypothetical protein
VGLNPWCVRGHSHLHKGPVQLDNVKGSPGESNGEKVQKDAKSAGKPVMDAD